MRFKSSLFFLTCLSTLLHASNFSFTNEMKINDETNYRPDGRQKNEWTVAKGYYHINDDYTFLFDVDRDFVTYDESDKDYTAWDIHVALDRDVKEYNIFGRPVTSSLRLDYYWDKSSVIKETELGGRYITSLKINDDSKFNTTFLGRYVKRHHLKGDYDEGNGVFGIETSYYETFNKYWDFYASIKGYYGGYTDGGSTFYNDRDGFNYEGGMALTFENPLYDANELEIDFITTFATYWYAQGDDYENSSTKYTKTYIRPELKFTKHLNEDFKVYLSTRYNIFGEYAHDNDTTKGVDEWESTFGFNFKM